jgi:hypothetical protein
MAILGFIVLVMVGLVLVAYAIAAASVTASFAGKVEWPPVLVFGGVGALILWYAFVNAPFTIVFGAAA